MYYDRRGFPSWADADYPMVSAKEWPEKTRGGGFLLDHPEKARWVNDRYHKISFTAWTPKQEEHCKGAKLGLLRFLQKRSQDG